MEQWNDPQQAERFVRSYADPILRLCLSYSLSREDAQDICQDVFLKLLEGRRNFRDGEHEKAFVLRAAINACKDLLKSARHRRTEPLEPDRQVGAVAGDNSALWAAIGDLPRHYGAAVYLFYCEGYSTGEIARLCGCTPGAVRKRLSRARALLAEALEVTI